MARPVVQLKNMSSLEKKKSITQHFMGVKRSPKSVGGKRGSIVYSNIVGTRRNDVDFSNRTCAGHHNAAFLNHPSSLETLGIGMVSQIPIEPMHLWCVH
jgi:hypothetical protein